MKKIILVFGLLIVAILTLFQISKFTLTAHNFNVEIVIILVAIIFLFIGIYLNKKSLHKTVLLTNEINHQKIKEFEISKREYEVLQAVSKGLSNKEIAEKLFLSESTIKTHVSNLLLKLNAKRRTQAIQIAKNLQIL